MSDLSKRAFIATPLLAAAGLGVARLAQAQGSERPAPAPYTPPPLAQGPFTAAVDSLRASTVPTWFRDAKLGIWSHWGPQAVPGQGDWYARFMYVPGHPHYDHHVKTYGHPSEVGYKDLLKRTLQMHAHLHREWPRLAREYRAALGEITSPEAWEKTFAPWMSDSEPTTSEAESEQR